MDNQPKNRVLYTSQTTVFLNEYSQLPLHEQATPVDELTALKHTVFRLLASRSLRC